MSDEREFRIGDVRADVRESAAAAERPGLDAGVFPTLARILGMKPAEYGAYADAIATRVHEEEDQEVRGAMQVAMRLLPEIRRTFGR